MNKLDEQLRIHDLKVILMEVIIDLLDDDQLTKEEAAMKLSKVLDHLSVETPKLSFEQMTRNYRKEVNGIDSSTN